MWYGGQANNSYVALRLNVCRQPPFTNAAACVTLIRQSTFDRQLFEK
jgi:hypothetical protein